MRLVGCWTRRPQFQGFVCCGFYGDHGQFGSTNCPCILDPALPAVHAQRDRRTYNLQCAICLSDTLPQQLPGNPPHRDERFQSARSACLEIILCVKYQPRPRNHCLICRQVRRPAFFPGVALETHSIIDLHDTSLYFQIACQRRCSRHLRKQKFSIHQAWR